MADFHGQEGAHMNLRPFRRQTPEAEEPETGPAAADRAQELAPRPIHAEQQPRMYSLQLPSFTDRR
jgi:hypothetical protein